MLQGAVAIIVNLPAGCIPSSKSAFPGRLVLNNVTLEKIFHGTITKWSEITEDGDKVSRYGLQRGNADHARGAQGRVGYDPHIQEVPCA